MNTPPDIGGQQTQVQSPAYDHHTAGKVSLNHEEADIVPNAGIQAWLASFGSALAPSQAVEPQLLFGIQFHFYVVRPVKAGVRAQFSNIDGESCQAVSNIGYEYINRKPFSTVKGIVALQDGTILVPTNILLVLHNEAELAALMSFAISSVLQQQFYQLRRATTYGNGTTVQTLRHNDGNLCALVARLNEQAMRLGIRRMYLAGYDIRTAPLAWSVAKGKTTGNPIFNSATPSEEIPWYTAYAFDFISRYYRNVDYSKLKRGEAEYQQFLGELRKADPEAFTDGAPQGKQ